MAEIRPCLAEEMVNLRRPVTSATQKWGAVESEPWYFA